MTAEIFTAALLGLALASAAWLLLARGSGRKQEAMLPPHDGPDGDPGTGPRLPHDGHPVAQWGAIDAISIAVFVFVATFVLQILVLIVLSILAGIVDPGRELDSLIDTPAANTLFTSIQWIATVGVPLLFLRSRNYVFDRQTFGFRGVRNIGGAIGWWLLVMFVFYLILPGIYQSIIEYLDPEKLPDQDIVEPFGLTWPGFIIAMLSVVIATPVLEEFLFRGVIHQGLEHRLGFFAGALVSSLIFALFHIDYRLFFPIFMLGFGFALLLRKTGSIWPPIAGHFVVNLTGVLAQYWDLFSS